ncbi:MAG: hypothetical protein AB1726_05805 [Planctomycetota bacterium]
MNARPLSRVPLLLLAGLFASAAGAAAGRLASPAPQREAADELLRAQLEQELILAESTATMYGELESALRTMREAAGGAR